jgi:serine/threonine protein kinase
VSAVKVIQNFGQSLEARQEIQLHSELSQHEHYNILPLLQTMETPSYFFLVTPYMSRGTLEYQIRDRCHFIHNPSHILPVFRQIASAVAFCHEKGVAHRDIKPANILCDFDLQVYLGDFGLATTEYDSKSFWCGTRAYMGPAMISLINVLADGIFIVMTRS